MGEVGEMGMYGKPFKVRIETSIERTCCLIVTIQDKVTIRNKKLAKQSWSKPTDPVILRFMFRCLLRCTL